MFSPPVRLTNPSSLLNALTQFICGFPELGLLRFPFGRILQHLEMQSALEGPEL